MKTFLAFFFTIGALFAFSQNYLVIDTTMPGLQQYSIFDTIENYYPMNTVTLPVDVDDDGTNDFLFTSDGSMGGGGGFASLDMSSIGNWSFVSDTMVVVQTANESGLSTDTVELVKKYLYGDTIYLQDYFIQASTKFFSYFYEGSYSSTIGEHWLGTSGFIGIRCTNVGGEKYGWIKINIESIMISGILETAVYDMSFRIVENQGNEASIYPNPATEFISIRYHDLKKIFLVDLNGRMIIEQYVEKPTSETTLDISSLTAGIYMVCLTAGNNMISVQKLIVF